MESLYQGTGVVFWIIATCSDSRQMLLRNVMGLAADEEVWRWDPTERAVWVVCRPSSVPASSMKPHSSICWTFEAYLNRSLTDILGVVQPLRIALSFSC